MDELNFSANKLRCILFECCHCKTLVLILHNRQKQYNNRTFVKSRNETPLQYCDNYFYIYLILTSLCAFRVILFHEVVHNHFHQIKRKNKPLLYVIPIITNNHKLLSKYTYIELAITAILCYYCNLVIGVNVRWYDNNDVGSTYH